MTQAPAPQFILVTIFNTVCDVLIQGLGETAAVAAATTYAPWLALPIISWIFKSLVSYLANALDTNLKNSVDIVLIRFGNDARRAAYEEALKPIRSGNPSPQEIQNAKDTLDRLIHRGS